MSKYRKKPVVVEAMPWSGRAGTSFDDWLTRDDHRNVEIDSEGALLISTLEGKMRADVGDWVIRGVQGELYPCKPDIFAATYEAVSE